MMAIVGKASLVGHSDNNAAEDTGHLHVTECNNVSIFGAYGSVRTGFASKTLYKTYYFALHRTLILFPIQYWLNIGSRTPSLRYGVGHVYNSYLQYYHNMPFTDLPYPCIPALIGAISNNVFSLACVRLPSTFSMCVCFLETQTL